MTTEQREAVSILADEHAEVAGLVDRLAPELAQEPGLGGGDWSVKDLVGHLTSWEEYALAAIGAWGEGRRAPIDEALEEKGLDAVNREAVEMRRGRPYARIRREFDEVHAALLVVLREIPADVWTAPASRRSREPLDDKVGGILGGPAGPFHHAADHLPDLEAFVADRAPA
jgi:hypothetical protein